MNQDFIQNALSWGEGGQEWLDSIPRIISESEKKWNLKVGAPFKLNYNYVAPAILSNDNKAVLKIGFPRDEEFQTEIKALSIFNGDGIAKLLKKDLKKSVILIEQVSPGTPLSQIDDDDEATRILAKVMKQLKKPLPANHKFITIKNWSQAIPNLKNKFKGKKCPIPKHLLDKAQSLFDELIATSQNPILLHGDLHHDNVLSSKRDKWLAIDPKGIAAEPAYEVAAMIRNPYEKLKNIANLQPILNKRISILAKELNLDPKRIHKWCLAQTILSAVWSAEEGAKTPDHALKVARVLDEMRF